MKRKGYLIEQITDIDNLRLAYWKAQKRKSIKPDVVEFRSNFDENILTIQKELLAGSYHFGRYHFFTIYDPKQRVICAAPFTDRIVHHAIINICAIDFENRQIPYSYACRKNKGTFAAVNQAARNQTKYKWFLKLDIRKYFDSIDHQILFNKLLRMYKDKKLLDMFWQIIDSYHAVDGKGVPIGNLTSQYFANYYLSFADKYILEKLKIPAYVRYMDDMLLWSNDRDELNEKGNMYVIYLSEHLNLTLKTFVFNKTEHGLSALGFQLFPNQIKLNKRSRIRYASIIKELNKLLEKDIINENNYSQRVLSAYSYISHAQSIGFARKILTLKG